MKNSTNMNIAKNAKDTNLDLILFTPDADFTLTVKLAAA